MRPVKFHHLNGEPLVFIRCDTGRNAMAAIATLMRRYAYSKVGVERMARSAFRDYSDKELPCTPSPESWRLAC